MRSGLLAVLLAGACAASDGVTPPAPAHAPADAPAPAATQPPGTSPSSGSLAEFAAAATPLRCARALRCGEIGISQRDHCLRDDGSRQQLLLGVERGLAAGRYRFDPELARACLRVLAEAPCHLDYETIPRGCLSGAVPSGLVPAVMPGGACERWEECVDGICSGDSGCPGICQARTPNIGGPCDHNTLCSEQNYCDDTCRPRGDIGASCNGHWQACKPSLVCQGYVPENDSHHDWRREQPGTCEARRGLDQPCRRESLGDDCAPEFFCDFGAPTPVCRARLGDRAACTWPGACADNLRCDGIVLGEHAATNGSGMRALDKPGVCKPVSDADNRCDHTAFQTNCPNGMSCSDADRCVPRGDTGAPCRERNDCGPYHFCDTKPHTCQPQGALGESCTPGTKGLDGPCFLSECDPTTRRCTAQCRRDK